MSGPTKSHFLKGQVAIEETINDKNFKVADKKNFLSLLINVYSKNDLLLFMVLKVSYLYF